MTLQLIVSVQLYKVFALLWLFPTRLTFIKALFSPEGALMVNCDPTWDVHPVGPQMKWKSSMHVHNPKSRVTHLPGEKAVRCCYRMELVNTNPSYCYNCCPYTHSFYNEHQSTLPNPSPRLQGHHRHKTTAHRFSRAPYRLAWDLRGPRYQKTTTTTVKARSFSHILPEASQKWPALGSILKSSGC